MHASNQTRNHCTGFVFPFSAASLGQVNGKQLSDCLDSSCSWPDTPAVVSFAKEAWHCVSRRGDDRPRLPHLIQRMERLDITDASNDDAPEGDGNISIGATSGGSNTSTSSGTDLHDGASNSGPGSTLSVPEAAVPQRATTPPARSPPAPPVAAEATPPPSTAASAAAVAVAAAATAARAAAEAAAAAAAASAARDREASVAAELARTAAEEASVAAAPGRSSPVPASPAMADAAAGGVASPPPASEVPPPRAGRECMICASAPVQTCFLPCRHSLACLSCASLLRARGDRCPVDRARIESIETGQFQVTFPGN